MTTENLVAHQAREGPSTGADVKLRVDSTFLVDFSDKLTPDGLFQFELKQPCLHDQYPCAHGGDDWRAGGFDGPRSRRGRNRPSRNRAHGRRP